MGSRGRPQYAIVRLPPNADLGALFILLYQNNYSEFRLVNDISEACGCTAPGSSSSAQGAEIEGGDTDSEPRPSPSSLPTSNVPHSAVIERLHQPSTSTATPMHIQTMFLPSSTTNKGLGDLVVKQEVADVSDVCTTLKSLPTLIQQLQSRPGSLSTIHQMAPSTSSGSPSPREEIDLKTSVLHINLDQSGHSAHDESDPALNASAGSDPGVELSDHDPTTIPPNLVHLVSSLFPSTSIQNGGEITLGSLLDGKLQQSRKSLGSVIERLHSNGTSPVPEGAKRKSHSEWGSPADKSFRHDTPKKEGDYEDEERRKRNAEWTYKGDWTCKKCGSLVNPKHRTAQKLLRHMVSHGPRAWSCSGCNSKFGLHTSFVSHNKSVHNGEATPVSLRTQELEDIWFKLAHECFPDFVEQVHSCIKKTTHV